MRVGRSTVLIGWLRKVLLGRLIRKPGLEGEGIPSAPAQGWERA